ncbi:MAG: hypothetical protein HOC74_08895, partial [Gemmatimonadetes bacterium]|nr:hypothetical protein [Gemmatimonadota bacterium]
MKGLSARSFFFLAVLLFNVEKSAADPGDLLQTFLQPNPAVDDRFGWSVAWVDGHVFVGTPFDDTWETNAGAVYMFDVDGTLLQNFPSPNPAVSGLFGNSVAVMGDRFLVGANYDNGGTGAAYLFNVDGTLLQTFLSPNPGGANQFGNSVALTGNQVLVGAHQDLFGGTIRTGAAYLFDTDGTFLQKLQKPVPAVGDLFGLSVDLADGLALVGAYGDDTGAPNAGAAYLFGTDGTLLQTFLSPTPVADNHFGRSVALVDGLILVGAQGDNIGGAAYLFDTDGNLLHTFQKPTPAAYDAFGYSVAGEGDRVLIGAIGIGAVYLFGLDGTLLQTFLNPTPAGSEYFGSPVVFADGQVLVAAPREDSEATDAGAVYLFEGISADPVAVSLPEMTATYNQNILVPVSLSNVPSSGIVSAEVFLSYDSSLLTVNGVQTTGALSEGWSIQTNIIPGTGDMKILKIAAATNNLDIVTDGTLFDIDFTMADIRSPASSPLILEHVLLNDGDPENTTTDGSVTLVGVGGTIANDPTEIIPREDIIVIVTDIDEDRDILMKDSFDVRISNGAQSETLTVLESAVSSGIFEGAISTVFSLGSTSGDGKVQAQAGDVIQSCYDDWLDTAGNTIERCDDTNVIGGTDGAIRVTIVSQPGDTVRVRVTDADLNVDPDTPQSAQVTATNPTTGESETVNLNEDGDNSDVFFGLLFTAPGSTAGAPDDATLNTAKGDVLDTTYTDVVTEQGGTEDLVDDDEV